MNSRRYDNWDLALLLYALAGTLLSLAGALSVALVALLAYAQSDPESAQAAQWAATGLFCLALTGAPAIGISLKTILRGERAGNELPARRWLLLVLLFPLGLLLGWLAYERQVLTGLLGPLGQVLALTSPVAVAVILVRRRGPVIPLRRVWGHILTGLWAVPAIALVAEGIALLFGTLVGSVGLAMTPSGRDLITTVEGLLNGFDPQPSPDILADIALHPVVIILLVGFLGMAVPLIEELAKTASVWPLLRRKITGAEAFLGGALGGIGFALAEALFLAQPSAAWVVTGIARAGATMMHGLATGIASWALAEGILRQRWPRALAGIGAAVLLHGLWNVSAIGIGLTLLACTVSDVSRIDLLQRISSVSIGLIVTLGVAAGYLLPRLQHWTTRMAQENGVGSANETNT